MDIVNTLIFYISYAVRDRGEGYIRTKLAELFEAANNSKASEKVLERLASPSGPVTKMSSDQLTQRVALILRYGAGSVPCISPLVCIRLVQFAHGVLRLITDQSIVMKGATTSSMQQPNSNNNQTTTHELLQQVLVLDGQGIFGLQKVFRWVSQGMVALEQGFKAIQKHFSEEAVVGHNDEMRTLLLITTCRHAFTETILRIVHYKCFETGRRFLMDAVHTLLRIAGHELACNLLKLATCLLGDERSAAAHGIAEIMTSWHCIMTMTTATSGGKDSSRQFEDEIASETWCANHPNAGDMLLRVVGCIKSYAKDVALPKRHENSAATRDDSPITEREVPLEEHYYNPLHGNAAMSDQDDSEHSSDDQEDDADADADAEEEGEQPSSSSREDADERSTITLPQMYLQSTDIVPVEEAVVAGDAISSSRRFVHRNATAGDPTVATRHDPDGDSVWEFCWRAYRKGGGPLADIMPVFKPILVYSAQMARNMIALNAFYQHEHISRALLHQLESSCNQQRLRQSSSLTSATTYRQSSLLEFL